MPAVDVDFILTPKIVSEVAFVSLMGSTGVGRHTVDWWFN